MSLRRDIINGLMQFMNEAVIHHGGSQWETVDWSNKAIMETISTNEL